jgi:glycosyltransferase involved in cell wall biosynthesis
VSGELAGVAALTSLVRVVHVIQNLHYGGMEKLLTDIVQHIDKTRFESHVLTLQYLGRYSREITGHAGLHVAPKMSRLSLLRPAALAASIAELKPDIVHTHSGVWYKAARAARLAGVERVVHTEHGRQPENLLPRLLDRRAARLTETVVAVSQPLRTYMSERLRLPESQIVVVRNGVDSDRFRPHTPSGTLSRELGLRPDQPIVGSIGRLEPVKGYDVVIKAFSELCKCSRDDQAVLVIAGEGSARAELETIIGQLGLRDRVFLLGWRDDALDLYAHFRCFVLGSWSEGTSVSLLEAMACGVAPAVTAVGGNGDVLGTDLAGQLVPAGDVRALAACIAETLQPEAAREIGLKARRRIETNFGLGDMVRAYESIYDSG